MPRQQRLGTGAFHDAGSRRYVGVYADARCCEHRGASGCGLDVVRPRHRQPGHVGADLTQQVTPRSARHADELRRRLACRTDGLQYVAQGEGVALQQRPGKMSATMGRGEAEPPRSRGGVPFGGGRPG